MDPRSEQFKICPSVGRHYDDFAVQDDLAERGEAGRLGEPVGPFRAGARLQPGLSGLHLGKAAVPVQLALVHPAVPAGGAGTAVGSMGRKGAVMSPTSVADPGPRRPALGARYQTRCGQRLCSTV